MGAPVRHSSIDPAEHLFCGGKERLTILLFELFVVLLLSLRVVAIAALPVAAVTIMVQVLAVRLVQRVRKLSEVPQRVQLDCRLEVVE